MIIARPMEPSDRRFIVPTWVRSYAESPRREAPKRVVLRVWWSVVDRIMDAADTTAVLLCSEHQPTALHGWAVASGRVLHYAYVPPELRERGFARKVIVAALGDYPDAISTSHPWPTTSARFRWDPSLLSPRKAA